MKTENVRSRLLEEWARYLAGAAAQGTFTRKPLTLQIQGVIGPRAGALDLYAGVDAPKLLTALSRNDAALLRQFVPWAFVGNPMVYMSSRFVRVEAGWPDDLAEKKILLKDLGQRPDGAGRWIAGKTEGGSTVMTGLNDRTPHFLISGQTGSGKTVVMRSAVLQLTRDPLNRTVLVDGKMGEGLQCLAHLRGVVGPVATDGPDARAALGWAVTEMKRRYLAGGHDGRVVVVIDEFQEYAGDPTFVDLFRMLAAQGRAAGVHLLAGTQHPTVESFGDPTIRRNLTGKLALRVGDPDASRVAVGGQQPRADYLLGAGDAYAVGPGTCHRVQMAYVDQAEISVAAGGEWEIDEWGELDGEAVGLDLPEQQPAGWAYTGVELAHAVIAASEGEGRPAMIKRLESAGLGRPGVERARRLLALGKETHQVLKNSGYM